MVGTGTHLVDASYPGDGNYLPSISGTVALTAESTNLPGFSLTAQPTTQTVAAGGAAAYSLTLTPLTGFNQPVTLSCSGLDPGTTCSFSPATVPGGSGLSTLTVQTAATQARNASGPARRSGLIAAAGLFLIFLPVGARRKWRPWLMAVWLFAVLVTGTASMTGCNANLLQMGETSSSTQTILVTGSTSSGSQPITATVTVNLIVQTTY